MVSLVVLSGVFLITSEAEALPRPRGPSVTVTPLSAVPLVRVLFRKRLAVSLTEL